MNAIRAGTSGDAGRLLACEAIVRCSTSPNADRLADWLRDLRLAQPQPEGETR